MQRYSVAGRDRPTPIRPSCLRSLRGEWGEFTFGAGVRSPGPACGPAFVLTMVTPGCRVDRGPDWFSATNHTFRLFYVWSVRTPPVGRSNTARHCPFTGALLTAAGRAIPGNVHPPVVSRSPLRTPPIDNYTPEMGGPRPGRLEPTSGGRGTMARVPGTNRRRFQSKKPLVGFTFLPGGF